MSVDDGFDWNRYDRIVSLLRSLRDDMDGAVAVHDVTDPRHQSRGGQHTNGRCCAFGNLNPGAVLTMSRWVRLIDEVLQDRDVVR